MLLFLKTAVGFALYWLASRLELAFSTLSFGLSLIGVMFVTLSVSSKFDATFHLAQYVELLPGTVLEVNIWTPPEDALVLNQPTKVYPDLVFGVGNVPKVLPGVKLDVGGEPVPPL